MKYLIFLFLLVTASKGKCNAIPVIELDSEKVTYQIGPSAQILEDKTGRLTINDVITDRYKKDFKSCKSRYPNLGLSSSAFWIRFKIRSAVRFKGFLFNIGYLFYDRLEMYKISDGIPEQLFFSDINEGSISHNHRQKDRFAVPLDFTNGEENEYYLSIQDHEGITLILELTSEESFLKRQTSDGLRAGMVAGIFILAAVFAFIVYLRDRYFPYLLFFLLNIFYTLSLLSHNGNLQMMLWPGNMKLNHDFFIFSSFMTYALSFLFTVHFLNLKKSLPSLYMIGTVVSLIMIVAALSPLAGLDRNLLVFYLAMITGALFEIGAGIMAVQRRLHLSVTFLLSRVIFSGSILFFGLMKLGILPYFGYPYETITDIFMCLQVSVMTFAITDYRYKLEIGKLEKEKDREKQRNEELHNASKVKMEFLGMASHDLKGPLRNISSLASFIENKQVSKEDEVIHMASMIRQASEKLANLVKDLLDNTALEMGKLELKLEETDILKSIRTILDQYDFEAKRKNQKVHLIVNSDQKFKVVLDEIRFSQVIENLVSNAIKFSPLGKNIWIIVTQPLSGSVRIEVKDEGPGFTEDDKKYLFNYYKKLSAKPTGKENSSGLGLSIVKKIVELHNGKIWLESEQGNGASFFVEI